jgi:hypothetical protein
MMFVGYSHNCTNDCCHMWKKETNCVIESQDIIWLNEWYFKSSAASNPMGLQTLEPSNNLMLQCCFGLQERNVSKYFG